MENEVKSNPIHPNPSGRRVREFLMSEIWRRRRTIIRIVFWITKKLMENQ